MPIRFVSTALFLLFAITSAADAHAFLLKSEPVVGATIPALKTVRLEFSEAVELIFSGIDVAGVSGRAIPVEHLRYAGSDRKTMLVDLPPLAAGGYRVKWHVVSVDSHRTEGDFRFTIKP